MNIYKKISRFNHSPGTVSRIKYIVIHYCGNTGDARDQVDYFFTADRQASAHYFVGHNGDVWQCVEDANIAWHCGSKKYQHPECRNSNSLGIEMCCKTTGSPQIADEHWYFSDATVNSTIELTKMLMKKYNIPDSNVIRHNDVTGKICPAPYVFNKGKHKWDQFKQAIGENEMAKKVVKNVETPDNSKVIWDYLVGKCGLSDHAAAGVMGNLYAESELKPTNLQNGFEKKLQRLADQKPGIDLDDGVKISYERFAEVLEKL